MGFEFSIGSPFPLSLTFSMHSFEASAYLSAIACQVCLRIDNKWVAVKPHGGVALTEDKNRERAKDCNGLHLEASQGHV